MKRTILRSKRNTPIETSRTALHLLGGNPHVPFHILSTMKWVHYFIPWEMLTHLLNSPVVFPDNTRIFKRPSEPESIRLVKRKLSLDYRFIELFLEWIIYYIIQNVLRMTLQLPGQIQKILVNLNRCPKNVELYNFKIYRMFSWISARHSIGITLERLDEFQWKFQGISGSMPNTHT